MEARAVYPGVDLCFYGQDQEVEYDLRIAPGHRPESIRLDLTAGDSAGEPLGTTATILPNGDLSVRAPGCEVRQRRPIAYQEVDGTRQAVPVTFQLLGKSQVGFRVGHYDSSRPLVIDPVLAYSTYLGGSADEADSDASSTLAVDAAGNSYLVGTTRSMDFPTTPGAIQGGSAGLDDIFIAKFDPSGQNLVYATYLGGSGFDIGRGIRVDGQGRVYVTGYTTSIDFPITNTALQGTSGGTQDAIVAQLSADGSTLLYATYLGGQSFDEGHALDIDPQRNIYVTGFTRSSNFITTPGAFGRTFNSSGSGDVFVTKINPALATPVYSTLISGSNFDEGWGLVVEPTGEAVVVGETLSGDYPLTQGAFDLQQANSEGFVTKVNAAGSGLLYSTYLGGGSRELAFSVALDLSLNAYVTGFTSSTDFPLRLPAQAEYGGGGADAFVTKFTPAGAVVYSSFLGGASADEARAIATDGEGRAFVAGFTSTGFPLVNPIQTSVRSNEGFLTEISTDGDALLFSTYLGGNGEDFAAGVGVDGGGNIYVGGTTSSIDFPIRNARQDTLAGGVDAFLLKIATGNPTGPQLSNCTVSPTALPFGGGDVFLGVEVTAPAGVATVVARLSLAGQPADTVVLRQLKGSLYGGTFTAPANRSQEVRNYAVRFRATDSKGATAVQDCDGFTVAAGSIGISVTPRRFAFGRVRVGLGLRKRVRLRNTSSEPVTLRFSRLDAPFYLILPAGPPPPSAESADVRGISGFTLGPNESRVLTVQFSPQATRRYRSRILINRVAQPGVDVAVDLSGEGCRQD